MKEFLKFFAENVPFPVGKVLTNIPMEWRLGRRYRHFQNCFGFVDVILGDQHKYYKAIEHIVNFADQNTLIYQYFPRNNNQPISISSRSDIEALPIFDKKMLRSLALSDRGVVENALKKSNTGGTTGQPLDFYVEKYSYAREWAHMHAIWATLGYDFKDLKLTIRGQNIGARIYKYNFNQNEFLINAYEPVSNHLSSFRELISSKDFKWIHGYPSAVYSFLKELENVDSALFEDLLHKVHGVFLGSEFPAPQYRDYIENYCGLKTISWYGHSEMAVLAPEREPGSGVYWPLYSYGFPEAIPSADGYRLVATSIFNNASPFVRYDTGDLIEPTFNEGFLESFTIKEGRNSDFVIDLNGRAIPLTALIFGRHHLAFEYCEHVQVRQVSEGKIEIVVTSKTEIDDWSQLFDFNNSFFDVCFTQVQSPVRTPSGKVQLLLR